MLGVIILAAGRGTRMKSKTPKVLHPIAGRPMLHIILDELAKLNPHQRIVVTSDDIRTALPNDVTIAHQTEALGTGHAVLTALDHIAPCITDVLICCGDTPLLHHTDLTLLLQSTADVAVIGMDIQNNVETAPYGRLVCDDAGPLKIVEVKDASNAQKRIPLGNSGVYKIKTHALKSILPLIQNTNNGKEYYLTDCIALARENGFTTDYVNGAIDCFLGVNTQNELSHATTIYQNRLRAMHMKNGVTLLGADTVFFHFDTKIDNNVTIHPFVTFGPNVVIESGATILGHCHIEHAHIGPNTNVGPFAHLRGGVIMDAKSSVGNFVEAKATHFKSGSKVKHLSYLGDAKIGENANIGAGTITCNYNGFQKFKTHIGDGAFIGSNTSLVAPVNIGNGAIVAAGSVITQSVKDNALAMTRPTQLEKSGWAETFRTQQMAQNKATGSSGGLGSGTKAGADASTKTSSKAPLTE